MTTAAPSGPARGLSPRALAAVALAAAALGAATMILPPLVAEWSSPGRVTIGGLAETVTAGFSAWMSSQAAAPAAPLADAVAFWAVFHVVKAVLATALLCALVVVGCHVWGRAARAEPRAARAAWLAVGVLGAGLPVLALLVVLANVQGALAPLSSVMSFLPVGATPEAGPVAQVRDELATGAYGPVTGALVADFRTYHAVLVACLAVVIGGLWAAVVWMLVRRARTPRTARLPRRFLASGAGAVALLTVALGVTLLANMSTVADPARALAGFFGSGGS